MFILILHCCTFNAFSQGGSTGTRVSATVIEPITLTKSVDLNFDQVAIIIAGSVELVPTGVKSSAANIILPVTMGTFTAASFVVAGTTAYTYKITVPPSPFEVTNETGTMSVRSFDSDPILNADSELLAGVFVSVSPMNVTVNYN
jgi:mannose/fructose/N-acetylgalactosamine-specific phosphotransferase system component IIC